MANIRITLYDRELAASLDVAREIGKRIFDSLPLTARFNRWGEELFFDLDLSVRLAFPVEVVQIGDIAYSEMWKAFCIFYGKTPLSSGGEIIPNGPVEVIGRLDGSAALLRKMSSGYFPRIKRKLLRQISTSPRFADIIRLEKSFD